MRRTAEEEGEQDDEERGEEDGAKRLVICLKPTLCARY
jgi:hypothetical protein